MSNEISEDFVKVSQIIENIFLSYIFSLLLSNNEISSDSKACTIMLLVVKTY